MKGTGLSPGSKRSFYCAKKDWVLSGAGEITCLDNGEWSEPLPRCIPKGK